MALELLAAAWEARARLRGAIAGGQVWSRLPEPSKALQLLLKASPVRKYYANAPHAAGREMRLPRWRPPVSLCTLAGVAEIPVQSCLTQSCNAPQDIAQSTSYIRCQAQAVAGITPLSTPTAASSASPPRRRCVRGCW